MKKGVTRVLQVDVNDPSAIKVSIATHLPPSNNDSSPAIVNLPVPRRRLEKVEMDQTVIFFESVALQAY